MGFLRDVRAQLRWHARRREAMTAFLGTKPLPVDQDGMMPYRVEWASPTVRRWTILVDCPTIERALEAARDADANYGGTVRIVSQMVIGVSGLGRSFDA